MGVWFLRATCPLQSPSCGGRSQALRCQQAALSGQILRAASSKRNRACELARGTFIAQWDDDDWYAPSRLSSQLEPLLSGAAQISGLSAGVFFDLSRWQFWRISPHLHRRMFVGDVHGGTLVYHR